MQNKPKPHPAPKAFDVFKPGKAQPTATSRPVIVSHRPAVQDSTVVERPGNPIANSHQIIKHSQSYGRGGQHNEAGESAPPEPAQTAKSTPPPSAGTHHSRRKPTLLSLGMSPEEAHRSRSGHTIALPAAHETETETELEVPTQMAAEPIVPSEVPRDQEKPTEGKAELLAALPIELRRSIASDQGNLAAGFDQEPISLQQQRPKQPAPETHDVQQHEQQPQPTHTDPDPEPEQHIEQQEAGADAATLAAVPDQQPERRRYEGAVFVIMFVLFLLLTTVIVMLFLSGSISI
jgi:hypothetical protein